MAVAAFEIDGPAAAFGEEKADAERCLEIELPSLADEALGQVLVDVIIDRAEADLEVRHAAGIGLDEIVTQDDGGAREVIAGAIENRPTEELQHEFVVSPEE